MKNSIRTPQSITDNSLIPNITLNKPDSTVLNMTPNISQPSSGKIIQNSNGHALLNQLINKMAAYEACAARNEDFVIIQLAKHVPQYLNCALTRLPVPKGIIPISLFTQYKPCLLNNLVWVSSSQNVGANIQSFRALSIVP